MSARQKILWASIGAILYQIAHAVFVIMTGYTAEEMAKFARSIL